MPQLTSNTFLFAYVLHFLSYLIPFKYVLRVLTFPVIFRYFLHVLSYTIKLNSEFHVLYYPNLFNPILSHFSSFSYLYIQYILFNAVLIGEIGEKGNPHAHFTFDPKLTSENGLGFLFPPLVLDAWIYPRSYSF